MLNLDASLLGIALLVGILLLVLNRLYYKPIGKVLEERESKIKNDTSLIDSKAKEIETLTLDIEKNLKNTQKEARKIKEESIKKGEAVREKMLHDAREKAKSIFETRMKQLDAELQSAEKELEQQIGVFSDKIKKIFVN